MLGVFPLVSGDFENSLSKPNSPIWRRSKFQVVFLGYCQTTVNSVFREALQATLLKGLLRERSDTLPDQVGSLLLAPKQYRTRAQCQSIPLKFD
jgi:hypothetical protein